VIGEGGEGGGERFDKGEEGGSERREYEEQEGQEEEENGMPHVVENCLSTDAVNSEPFISTLNLLGYSMVTKAELVMHFLPKDWRGTVVVKPAMGDPLDVALSPEPDLEGTGLMWRLDEGAYSMEAIPAEGRQSGQPMQQGSKRVRKCSTAPSVSVGASVRRSFHTAATSFASIASLSTGSPLKLPTRRKGQGPSNSLSMYLADKFGKWKRKNEDKEETVKLERWETPSPAVSQLKQVNWGRGWKPLGGDDSMKKRRQRLEGDEWASGWPFKKGSQ
jgi:hypothetical protein